MCQLLIQHGFQEVRTLEEALLKIDFIIINTCTVTSKADAKCRSQLKKMRTFFPSACIILCGCMVEKENYRLFSEADILLDNRHKNKIIKAIEYYQNKLILEKPFLWEEGEDGTFHFSTHKMTTHSRALVKIQDGCDNFCSYCKIPYVRGRSRSRDPKEILEDVLKIEENGYKEVILTGVNISDYQFEEITFSQLLEKLLLSTAEIRIRLSSLEPQNITPEFYKVIQNKRICPHFHIALQSGSDKVLELMNRKYKINDFLFIVHKIRENRVDPFISTDLILGFPGETEKDFADTIQILKKLHFSFIHVFGFSPRKGTKAFRMIPKVPERIRDERVQIIGELNSIFSLEYAKKFLGKVVTVLIEKKDKFFYKGKSENYLDIFISADSHLEKRKIYPVKIIQIKENGMIIGELFSSLYLKNLD